MINVDNLLKAIIIYSICFSKIYWGKLKKRLKTVIKVLSLDNSCQI